MCMIYANICMCEFTQWWVDHKIRGSLNGGGVLAKSCIAGGGGSQNLHFMSTHICYTFTLIELKLMAYSIMEIYFVAWQHTQFFLIVKLIIMIHNNVLNADITKSRHWINPFRMWYLTVNIAGRVWAVCLIDQWDAAPCRELHLDQYVVKYRYLQ